MKNDAKRLEFIEQELRTEIKELREWAKEDESDAKDTGERDEKARLNARASAYRHCADQMERILKGQTAKEALEKRLKIKL